MTQLICGVNDSSRWLDASLGSDGAHARFPNTAEGIAELAVFCHTHAVTLVAMEATGGYERQAFTLLIGNGLSVAILNPRSVRQFASGMGRLEKTDRIDAGMIAWFAAVKGVRPTQLSTAGQLELRALVTRLRQLTDLRSAQRDQQRLLTNPRVEACFAELLALVAGKPTRSPKASPSTSPGTARGRARPRLSHHQGRRRPHRRAPDGRAARVGTLSGKAISKLAGFAPLASPRWPRTAADTTANEPSGADEAPCATFCSSSPASFGTTNWTSPPPPNGSPTRANHLKSSA